MGDVLVTGGTGNLGRVVCEKLREAGHEVRVLSRRPQPGHSVRGDLRTGEGVPAAVEGVDTILHLATAPRGDAEACSRLIAATQPRGPHMIFTSIVGVDRIPLAYYAAKAECERLIETSGLPYTIQRATQFHSLIMRVFHAQRRLPLMFAPTCDFQPVDVHDVADRLVQHVDAGPRERVPDIGGPEIRSGHSLAKAYLGAARRRRRVVNLALPGRVFSSFRAGANLAPDQANGGVTFEEFLAERF
ncbi:SDR family oxidoreductase [Asanoa iriomotensis]|uniref:Nucleotide-diphosphate-sugar epimerase n=1 Tax=Asanoa iriomotensis TaxID=234613 RepID=A0ABQ4C8Z2_9ACTN|nr:NAD(P)H-binding protein [Asanoa iriomotensis]GIF59251.1 nucleotide-diphosphate-sugar epimerase [Asanoa iriomotensis]